MGIWHKFTQNKLFTRRVPAYKVEPRLARDMQLVIWAMAVGTISFNINNGTAFTGFSKAMGFDDFFYGLMMGMPVFGAMMQMVAAYMWEKTRNRRRLFLAGGIIGRLMWIPIALVPVFVPETMRDTRLWSVILLLTLFQSFNSVTMVGFFAWMSDLIPVQIRGRYFSKRSAIATVSGLLTGWFVGWYLDAFPGIQSYTVLLMIAGIAGAMDIAFFFFINDPPKAKGNPPALTVIVRETLRNKKFMSLIVYAVVFTFGIQVSAPFYTMYALNIINMTFTQLFLFSQLTSCIFNILAIRVWGSALDRFGNIPMLRIAGMVCSALPLLWIFTAPGVYWIVMVVNVLGGIFWGAVELGTTNMMMGLSPQENRSMYVALYFIGVTAIGTAVANITGGALLSWIEPYAIQWNLSFFGWSLTKYHYLFILSALIRYGALIFLAPRIQEDGAHTPGQVLRTVFARNKHVDTKG